MLDPLALLAFAVICGIVGFTVGRISNVPDIEAVPPAPLDLSDTARAHISHEAIRAYERSLGVIRFKSWNNLPVVEREFLVESMQKLRSGDRILCEQGSAYDRILRAAATL